MEKRNYQIKKKKYIALIAALTLSSAFVLNGCSLALPGEETKISTGAELSAEQEILTDGNVQLHTRWYNADGSRLAGATVTVYDGNDQLFQGTTDENGNLEACTLPGNKELRCVITDSSENELAKSDILYKISDNYQAITVYTTHGEADTQKVEIPTSKTVLSAAIYLTENKTLSHANITEYIASDEENTTDAATDGTATDAAQPTDGQQQADPNSADANATDANQQSDAATQSTDQGADQAQTQPATDQQPVVTQ